MPARVPLDVDLEDKLLYGLTPVRLGYIVLAVLAGLAMWSSTWAPVPVRAIAAVSCIGIGATVSWGRWRGKPADTWIVDVVLFMARTHRLAWNLEWLNALARTTRPMSGEVKLVDDEARSAAA